MESVEFRLKKGTIMYEINGNLHNLPEFVTWDTLLDTFGIYIVVSGAVMLGTALIVIILRYFMSRRSCERDEKIT